MLLQASPDPTTLMSATDLNSLDLADAYAMLGRSGLAELEELALWLNGGASAGDPGWRARLAPSMVVQSEAELFGLAMPRFALRYYVGEHSFVNARRVEVFRRQVEGIEFGIRRSVAALPGHPDLLGLPAQAGDRALANPGQALGAACKVVADSLLQPPAELAGAYHVLAAKLGIAYGEQWEPGQNFAGTPYMRHINLAGGGLCAQAVCFMATCLLYEHAPRIYGLAEITHLAAERAFSELCISGLSYAEIMRYFEGAGLRCRLQKPKEKDRKPPGRHFSWALRSYLGSGMPVVLPVDAGRLAGRFNGVEPEGWRTADLPREDARPVYDVPTAHGGTIGSRLAFEDVMYPHVVLLVGVSHDGTRFLVNDPLTFPFLKATAGQLARAASYDCDPATSGAKQAVRTRLDEQFLMPVTPGAVRVPLLHVVEPGPDQSIEQLYERGLLPRLEVWEDHGGLCDRRPVRKIDEVQWPHRFDHVRLLRVRDVAAWVERIEPAGPRVAKKLRTRQVVLERKFASRDAHWVWVQMVCHSRQRQEWSLLICDAEAPLPDAAVALPPDEAWKYCGLRMLVETAAGIVREPRAFGADVEAPPPPPPATRNERDVVPEARLRRSLIVSFNARGLRGCLQRCEWPASGLTTLADPYCFMQWDELLDRQRVGVAGVIPGPGEVAEALARLEERGQQSPPGTVPFLTGWRALAEAGVEKGQRDRVMRAIRALAGGGELPDGAGGEPMATAMDWAAEHADNGGLLDEVAADFDACALGAGVELAGFATFLPEVSAADGVRSDRARRALRFVVGLACRLRARGHPMHAIEIVGGSLIDGVWPAFDRRVLASLLHIDPALADDEKHMHGVAERALQDLCAGGAAGDHVRGALVYGATLRSPQAGLDCLLEALEPAATLALQVSPPVYLAAEMQPGPFYVLGDFVRMRAYCDALDDRLQAVGEAQRSLGMVGAVNLDLPHWAQLGVRDFREPAHQPIRVAEVRQSSVYGRLGHAHVSDHGHGHFCDNVLESHTGDVRAVFGPWVDLVRERVAADAGLETKRSQHPVRCSGVIAVELEMCRTLAMVEACLERCVLLGF